VSPAFLVRSTFCCRVLYDTRPPLASQSSSGSVAVNLGRVGPPCSARGLHASGRFPPWAACVGHVSAFQAAFGAVRCFLVVGCAGIIPGMARGLHASSLRRCNYSPTVTLFVLSVFCADCIFPYCLCDSQCLCSAQIFTGLICSVEL
jgi:hypothetical protein